jgi:hypothetical protein
MSTSSNHYCYYHWNAVWLERGEYDETDDFLAVIYNAEIWIG